MSNLDIYSAVVFLIMTHIGFFIAGVHFAVKAVNLEVNK